MVHKHESRRSFGVKVMSAAAVGAVSNTSTFASDVLAASDAAPDQWRKLVGQRFSVTAETGETVTAELSEVEEQQRLDPDRDASLPRRQSFSLVFRSEESIRSDVSYQLQHPSASQPFVLIPVGAADDRELEAVFN